MQIEILSGGEWADYALLDCGHRQKLERFGEVTVVRSEPKAWWPPALPQASWKTADASYDDKAGKWSRRKGCPVSWELDYHGVTFEAKLSNGSKHLGVFPEQSPHWEYLKARCCQNEGACTVLNLFGYTGAASLIAAQAGAKVTHLDASKPAIAWGRSNQERSGLADKPIRWILDDALKFVQREYRRGRRYDAILLDPPSFGRGPRGEVWKVDEGVVELLEACRDLLSEDAKFLLLTMYNLEASALMLGNLVRDVLKELDGKVSVGELIQRREPDGLYLPLSLFARWEFKV